VAKPPRKTRAEPDALPAHSPEVLAVEELKSSGWSTQRIVAWGVEKHSVHPATVYRWISVVEKAWAELAVDARPIRKAQIRAGLHHAIRTALASNPPQCAAVVRAWDSLADLDGAKEPVESRQLADAPATPAELAAAVATIKGCTVDAAAEWLAGGAK
jgi:hypothetical protein